MLRAIKRLIVALLMTPLAVPAQTITGVSGVIGHGNSVTISGSSFGTKSTGAPVVWDTVESGAFSSKWQSSNALSISTESRHANSHYCGTNNFGGGTGNGGHYGSFMGPNGSLGESWYAQYWFKLHNNFDWGQGSGEGTPDSNLSNVKIFRLWNPGDIPENFVLSTMGYSGGSLQYQTENIANNGGAAYFGNTSNWAKNVWHLFQFEFKESTVGVNDGIFRWWVDGSLLVDDHDLKTRQNYSQYKRPFILGFYNSWSDDSTDRDDFYIDDAYIDASWARVEIGNASTYSASTHREIQIPVAWTASQITVNVNTGSFTSGSPMYLFVVSANGQVSPGYPLTGGAPSPTPTLDTLAPKAPTNLIAN